MFGYVTPDKAMLEKNEFELFRAYYCGVCRAIGKNASQTSRMGLSYDITFLAIVLSSVYSDRVELLYGRCIAHPAKKRAYLGNDHVMDYAASVGVMLEFLKLADDWHDDHSIKALFGMLVLYKGYRKVRKKYRAQLDGIKKRLDELSRLEKERCSSIDTAADTFAGILEQLFTPGFVSDCLETIEEIESENRGYFMENGGEEFYYIHPFNEDPRFVDLLAQLVSDK